MKWSVCVCVCLLVLLLCQHLRQTALLLCTHRGNKITAHIFSTHRQLSLYLSLYLSLLLPSPFCSHFLDYSFFRLNFLCCCSSSTCSRLCLFFFTSTASPHSNNIFKDISSWRKSINKNVCLLHIYLSTFCLDGSAWHETQIIQVIHFWSTWPLKKKNNNVFFCVCRYSNINVWHHNS